MDTRPPSTDYRFLDLDKIRLTVERLETRVRARFPGSGLSRLVGELVQVCHEVERVTENLARPHHGIRAFVCTAVTLLIALTLGVATSAWTSVDEPVSTWFESVGDVLQTLEAGVNDVVFVGIAIWFLVGLEHRWKRSVALHSLRSLRALAHVVDMHQLTKDPERLVDRDGDRPSMTDAQLIRYLDYCSEALALTSKLAALHVQAFDDAETLAAVGEIEDLADGLARKVWQKIEILDRVVPVDHPEPH